MAIDTKLDRTAPLLAAALALLSTAGLYLVNPNTTRVPLCPLHAASGLWCPLCGSTRAAHALLHGQFGTAVHDNVLFMVGLPVLLLLQLRRTAAGGTVRLAPAWLGWLALAVAVAFGVLRNLPIGSWLAPPS